MSGRITIRDVAEACGFSEATVSNALADKPSVARKTKAKVFKVARQLGYEVSPIARALKTGKTMTIGVVVANLANPFYADILLGLSEVCSPLGYQVIVCNTNSKQEEQEFHIAGLMRHMVDGIILVPYSRESNEALRALDKKIPIVTIWRRLKNSAVPFVGLDDETGMRAAINHLWDLGHRNIVFIRAPAFSSPGDIRQEVFLRALRERGAKPTMSDVLQAEISIEGGRQVARRILASTKTPSAVIVSSELTAIGVTIALEEVGMRVPDNLSVVSFENTFLASLPQLSLTAVSVPRRDMGVTAAKMLLERINQTATPVESSILKPGFEIRRSTAAITSPIRVGRRRV